MKKQKLMLPLVTMLCVFFMGTANGGNLFYRLAFAKHHPMGIPYSLSYLAELGRQKKLNFMSHMKMAKKTTYNFTEVTIQAPADDPTDFLDWEIQLTQTDGSSNYDFIANSSNLNTWDYTWDFGAITPGTYNVSIYCYDERSGWYYDLLGFGDDSSGNEINFADGETDYLYERQPWNFSNVPAEGGGLYFELSGNNGDH